MSYSFNTVKLSNLLAPISLIMLPFWLLDEITYSCLILCLARKPVLEHSQWRTSCRGRDQPNSPLLGCTSQPGFIISTVRAFVQASILSQFLHWCAVELAIGTWLASDHWKVITPTSA